MLMPVPDATTDETVGAVVSICSVPAGLVTAPVRLAALPAPSVMVAPLSIDRGHRQVGGVLPGRHRVAEGQRAGAGTAGIGGRAAVVERQRRRAAATVTASLRLTVSVTVLPASRSPLPPVMPVPDATTDDTVGVVVSICRCRPDWSPHREVGGIAGAIGDGGAHWLDRRHRQIRRVLAGADRVAEGQRAGAGAAGIGRRAAVVERQRRRAAGRPSPPRSG